MEMTPVVTLFEAALQESYFAITGRSRYVVYEQAHLRPVLAFFELCFKRYNLFTLLRRAKTSRGGH